MQVLHLHMLDVVISVSFSLLDLRSIHLFLIIGDLELELVKFHVPITPNFLYGFNCEIFGDYVEK